MLVLNLDPALANNVAVTRIGGSIQVVMNSQVYTFAGNQVKGLQVGGATADDQVNVDPTLSVHAASLQTGASGALSTQQQNLATACACGNATLHPAVVAVGPAASSTTTGAAPEGRPVMVAANTANETATAAAGAARTGQERSVLDFAGFAGNNADDAGLPNAAPVQSKGRTPRAEPAPATDGAETTAAPVAAATPASDEAVPAGTSAAPVAASREQDATPATDRFFGEQLTPAAIESGTSAAPDVAEQAAASGTTGDQTAEHGGSSTWRTVGLAMAAVTALAITRHEIVSRRADRRPAPRRR
jgi:hypothetical protein